MHFGYVTVPGRGLIDDVLSEAVALLAERGVRLAGTVRALPVDHHAHPCDMHLRALPGGKLYPISQPLGTGSRGCRLAPDSIEALSLDVHQRLPESQLLVVNKFGKQECLGRGLLPVIVRALDLQIPVVVGVNRLNLGAFQAFAGGLAVAIEPDPYAVLAWGERAVSAAAMAVARAGW